MVRFGRIVYNLTGIMSNKGLVKNSNKIGEAVCDKMKASGGVIKPAEIETIIADTIGKKGASRIKVVESTNVAKKYALENSTITEKEFDEMYTQIMGFSVGNKYNREAILHVKNLDALDSDALYQSFGPAMLANTIAHEFQHSLTFSSGKSGLIRKFGKLSFIRKLVDKQEALLKQLRVQEKYHSLQIQALAEDLSNPEKVRELVQNVMTKGEDKNNLFIIQNLIKLYKNEARSYKVGFDIHCRYLEQELPNAKGIVEMYEKLVNALKQERSCIIKNKMKNVFGLS